VTSTTLFATIAVVLVVTRRIFVDVHLISAAVSDVGISVAPSFAFTVHVVSATAVPTSVSDVSVIEPPAGTSVAGVNQKTRSPAAVLALLISRLKVRVAPPKEAGAPASTRVRPRKSMNEPRRILILLGGRGIEERGDLAIVGPQLGFGQLK